MGTNVEVVEVCPLVDACEVHSPYSGRGGEEMCPLFVLAAQRWLSKTISRAEIELPAIVDCPKVDDLFYIA